MIMYVKIAFGQIAKSEKKNENVYLILRFAYLNWTRSVSTSKILNFKLIWIDSESAKMKTLIQYVVLRGDLGWPTGALVGNCNRRISQLKFFYWMHWAIIFCTFSFACAFRSRFMFFIFVSFDRNNFLIDSIICPEQLKVVTRRWLPLPKHCETRTRTPPTISTIWSRCARWCWKRKRRMIWRNSSKNWPQPTFRITFGSSSRRTCPPVWSRTRAIKAR